MTPSEVPEVLVDNNQVVLIDPRPVPFDFFGPVYITVRRTDKEWLVYEPGKRDEPLAKLVVADPPGKPVQKITIVSDAVATLMIPNSPPTGN